MAMHLLENLKLDELGGQLVYEFAFVMQPMKIQGGTGSTVAPCANPLRRHKGSLSPPARARGERGLYTTTGRQLNASLNIGFVLFPDLTQLDFTGPLQVLHRLPDSKVHIVRQDSAIPCPATAA